MSRMFINIFCFLISFFLFNTAWSQDLPKFVCTLTDKVADNDAPIGQKDTFTKDTPLVYLICQSDQVKKGQKIKADWIAEDTNNVAPPNYKIDEKTYDIDKDASTTEIWTVKNSLSKPNTGWPVGKYHVDLYVDDALISSFPFTVK